MSSPSRRRPIHIHLGDFYADESGAIEQNTSVDMWRRLLVILFGRPLGHGGFRALVYIASPAIRRNVLFVGGGATTCGAFFSSKLFPRGRP